MILRSNLLLLKCEESHIPNLHENKIGSQWKGYQLPNLKNVRWGKKKIEKEICSELSGNETFFNWSEGRRQNEKIFFALYWIFWIFTSFNRNFGNHKFVLLTSKVLSNIFWLLAQINLAKFAKKFVPILNDGVSIHSWRKTLNQKRKTKIETTWTETWGFCGLFVLAFI